MIRKFQVSGFKFKVANIKLCLLIVTFNISLSSAFAQNSTSEYQIKSLSVTLYSGISVPIKGTRYFNDNWEPEYLVGGNAFVHINNYLLVGLRCNFNHWLTNVSALTKNYPTNVDWTSIKGHVNVIEIVPSFRIILSDDYNKSNLFLQIGGGYFNIQGTYAIAGTFQEIASIPAFYYNDTKTFHFNEPGLNLGLGIKAGKVEIFPSYSLVFTPDDPTQFLTLNLGYHF